MAELTGRAKGGKAASDAMTPEQLRERAMKGVEARRALGELPRATHGSPDRPLRIGNIEIPCYVLNSELRVLSGRGLQTALNLGQGHGAILKDFLSKNALLSFINDELAMALNNPIKFVRPGRGGKTALGYEATILADICDAVLSARKSGRLSDRELMIADRCELLVRGFARVGIVALIDEATGYQDVRARDELNLILQSYIAKELLPWTKKFPDEFYKQIFRLHSWPFNPMSVKRPSYVGKLTNKLVYERLPEGVLEELKKINPPNESGNRNHRHHQFLTESIGHPHLEKHIASVTTLLRISDNWDGFKKVFIKAFPLSGDQQALFDDEEGEK